MRDNICLLLFYLSLKNGCLYAVITMISWCMMWLLGLVAVWCDYYNLCVQLHTRGWLFESRLPLLTKIGEYSPHFRMVAILLMLINVQCQCQWMFNVSECSMLMIVDECFVISFFLFLFFVDWMIVVYSSICMYLMKEHMVNNLIWTNFFPFMNDKIIMK